MKLNNTDIKDMKKIKLLLEDTFNNLAVEKINIIGQGHDSIAYLVNDEYIFKIKLSVNKKKGYTKEKAILDFLNKHLNTNIKIPRIDYAYITDELSIIGYKIIKGKFLTPNIYNKMTTVEKDNLKENIANFLKSMHSLDYSEISNYAIDNKKKCLEEYELLEQTIYNELTSKEKEYVENFYKRLYTTTVFDDKKCICHNDFSCKHLVLDDNNKLVGIIDFGDACIIDEYSDFLYLLEDSDEEVGSSFGEEILKIYKDININKAKEYQELMEQYYPIELIIYGIKNNNLDFIKEGRKEIKNRINN